MNDNANERAGEKSERRRADRRVRQITIFHNRRLGERRRAARDLLDRVRAFLGLAPLNR